MPNENNPAEEAAQRALDNIYACIADNKSFVLEAGAGSGKTYSLIKTLNHLIEIRGSSLLRLHQKIACITFTNVAKDQINSRTDKNPLIHPDTIHAFCWSLIKSFQVNLREELVLIPKWNCCYEANYFLRSGVPIYK
jgi:DNA helicase-2/ATP-dependent DNA helicase PcrA